jgi:hypothetical protein
MKFLDAHRAVAALRFSSLPPLPPAGQAVVLWHLRKRRGLEVSPVGRTAIDHLGGTDAH